MSVKMSIAVLAVFVVLSANNLYAKETASISDSAPVRLATAVLTAINSFAKGQAENLSKIKQKVDAEVAVLIAQENASTTKPFAAGQHIDNLNDAGGGSIATSSPTAAPSLERLSKQAYSWLLYALIYILSTPWLLYSVLVIILYWIYRFHRRRRFERAG